MATHSDLGICHGTVLGHTASWPQKVTSWPLTTNITTDRIPIVTRAVPAIGRTFSLRTQCPYEARMQSDSTHIKARKSACGPSRSSTNIPSSRVNALPIPGFTCCSPSGGSSKMLFAFPSPANRGGLPSRRTSTSIPPARGAQVSNDQTTTRISQIEERAKQRVRLFFDSGKLPVDLQWSERVSPNINVDEAPCQNWRSHRNAGI